jgi:ATP-binding cassette subfamily E protein 1
MAEQEKLTRIAIVNGDRCKPKKCRQECKKSCPVVRMGEFWGLIGMNSVSRASCNREALH